MKWCIALTATVRVPDAVPNLRIRDEQVRLRQYRHAIEWWAESATRHSIPMVIFENSGSAQLLAECNAVRKGMATVHEVDPPSPKQNRRGKGVGEAEILKHAAFTLSEFSHIVKCTGRIRVLNWWSVALAATMNSPSHAFVDWAADMRRVDTRFFVATPKLLVNWMERASSRVDEATGKDLEVVSADILRYSVSAGTPVSSFIRTPIVRGSSASTGTRYWGYSATARFLLERFGW